MALPSSGSISLSQVRTELSGSGSQSLKTGSELLGAGTAPYSLSELRGLSNDQLTLSIYSIDAISLYDTYAVTLTSNRSWSSTEIDLGDGVMWYNVNPTSGTGTTALTVTVFQSSETWFKDGRIRFTAGSKTADLDIRQEPQLACLSPDTPITMADNSIKLLGDIKIGDDVKSYFIPNLKDDESNVHTWTSNTMDNGYEKSAKVTRLVSGTYPYYFLINKMMKITYEHHVLIKSDNEYKFMAISKAKEGDCMWSPEFGDIIIDSKVLVKEPGEFITMDVEETDVYFAHDLLVHNPIDEKDNPPL